MKDLRQSEEYGHYMETLGWQAVEILNSKSEAPRVNFDKFTGQANKFEIRNHKLQIFIKHLGIFGAIAKIQRVEFPLPWGDIEKVLRENKVWMCKIEPDVKETSNKKQETIVELGKHGFKQDKWPLTPSKTIKVSLTTSTREMFDQFKKDARYCLRQAEEKIKNRKLKIERNKFEEFYICWKKAAKRKRLWISDQSKFRKMVEIFGNDSYCLTANKDGETLGGIFVLIADKTAYYYYSAGLPEGKKLNVPYLLVWEAMKEAKKRGCTTWDFEGIFDERWPIKSWRGFSHFKKSFGGREIEYPGSFAKWRLPI